MAGMQLMQKRERERGYRSRKKIGYFSIFA